MFKHDRFSKLVRRSPVHSSEVLRAIDPVLVKEFNATTLSFQWKVWKTVAPLVHILRVPSACDAKCLLNEHEHVIYRFHPRQTNQLLSAGQVLTCEGGVWTCK